MEFLSINSISLSPNAHIIKKKGGAWPIALIILLGLGYVVWFKLPIPEMIKIISLSGCGLIFLMMIAGIKKLSKVKWFLAFDNGFLFLNLLPLHEETILKLPLNKIQSVHKMYFELIRPQQIRNRDYNNIKRVRSFLSLQVDYSKAELDKVNQILNKSKKRKKAGFILYPVNYFYGTINIELGNPHIGTNIKGIIQKYFKNIQKKTVEKNYDPREKDFDEGMKFLELLE